FEEIRLSRYGPEIHRPGTPQILRSCCRRRMGELSGKRGTIGWSIRYRPFRPLDPFEKGEGIALFHLQRSFPSADLQVSPKNPTSVKVTGYLICRRFYIRHGGRG